MNNTILVLRGWNCEPSVRLDTSNGSFELIEANYSGKYYGFAHLVEGTAAAVYSRNHTVWLQHGQASWDLSKVKVRLQSHNSKLNEFAILNNNIVLKIIFYPAVLNDASNPAFDAIDEEEQDFFLWLSRMYRREDWLYNQNWQSGFSW